MLSLTAAAGNCWPRKSDSTGFERKSPYLAAEAGPWQLRASLASHPLPSASRLLREPAATPSVAELTLVRSSPCAVRDPISGPTRQQALEPRPPQPPRVQVSTNDA